MTHEDYQRELLLMQMNSKRELKQKYLRQEAETPQSGPLTDLVMTNIILFAIRNRTDIFGLLRQIQITTDPGFFGLNTALDWLQTISEALECSVYELFVDDRPRRERILTRLLRDLEPCDSWEIRPMDSKGNGSFALPGFDYAYRMSEQPSATLLFEKTVPSEGTIRYRLTLTDGKKVDSLIPGHAVLWEEAEGPLQRFMEGVLQEFYNGTYVLREQFEALQKQVQREAETLRDLLLLLEEAPAGLNLSAFLDREIETLKGILEKEKLLFSRISEGRDAGNRNSLMQNPIILLGGAIGELERMSRQLPESPQEQLSEIVYMLENAGIPV